MGAFSIQKIMVRQGKGELDLAELFNRVLEEKK